MISLNYLINAQFLLIHEWQNKTINHFYTPAVPAGFKLLTNIDFVFIFILNSIQQKNTIVEENLQNREIKIKMKIQFIKI